MRKGTLKIFFELYSNKYVCIKKDKKIFYKWLVHQANLVNNIAEVLGHLWCKRKESDTLKWVNEKKL